MMNTPAAVAPLETPSLDLQLMPDAETVSHRIMWATGHDLQRGGIVHDRGFLSLLLARVPQQSHVEFYVEDRPDESPRAQLVRDNDRFVVGAGIDWREGLGTVTQRGRVERTSYLWAPWCTGDVVPALDPVQILRAEWAGDAVWKYMNRRPLPHGLGLIDTIPGQHRRSHGD